MLSLSAIATLIVLITVIYLFLSEKVPAHLTAMGAMAGLLLFGVVSTDEVLSVFSNNAPITIACMFIISAALQCTGVIDALGNYLVERVKTHKASALLSIMLGVMVLSAFMNNTPLVMIMAPVIIRTYAKLILGDRNSCLM